MKFKLNRSCFTRFHKVTEQEVIKIGNIAGRAFWLKSFGWLFVGMTVFSVLEICKTIPGLALNLIPSALYLIAAFAVSWAANSYLKRIYSEALITDDGWYLSEQTVTPSDSGLSISTKFGKVDLRWDGILRVTEDAQNYYLYIEPGQGFIFPKEAITNPELRAQFADRAEPTVIK